MWWAAVSRAVDQSSARNNRNDRLAEGQACIAGAGMVLRIHSDRAPLCATCHCFLCERRYFPNLGAGPLSCAADARGQHEIC
jgi:hypothetical protein